MEDVSCILCESDTAELYAEENGYQSLMCSSCSLVYCSPRPTIDEMKALYQGQETKVNLNNHIKQRDYKCIQARKCLNVVKKHSPTGRLLEVGSAAGYFLWEAQRAGYDVQGLDITRQFVEFSNNVLGVPAHEGTLKDAPFPDGSFDVVYMRNVLSHLAYPIEEHERVSRLLRPGGFLVFETGNVAELTPQVAGELELPDHLFHFSEASIRALLERTGFKCVEVNRHSLLEHMAVIRGIKAAFTGKSRPQLPKKTLEMTLPDSRFAARLKSYVAQVIRYDLGRLLPKAGKRCTLVVVAQRLTTQ